jgi:hypothetical protein
VVYISPQARRSQRIEGHLASSSPLQLHDTHHYQVLRRQPNTAKRSNHKAYIHPTEGCGCAKPRRSQRTITLALHNRNHARPRWNATTATRRPNPQLRACIVYSIHALERNLGRLQLTIPNRCRSLRIHGARVPKRRFAVFVE